MGWDSSLQAQHAIHVVEDGKAAGLAGLARYESTVLDTPREKVLGCGWIVGDDAQDDPARSCRFEWRATFREIVGPSVLDRHLPVVWPRRCASY
ncbi:hypothetical protein CKO27_10715 [Thiocystis violacea]|nr:hypothetical protein [Thiocystis violacea]